MNREKIYYLTTGFLFALLMVFVGFVVLMWVRFTPLSAVDIIFMKGVPDEVSSVLSADSLYGAIVGFYDSLLTYIAVIVAIVAIIIAILGVFGFFNLKSHLEKIVKDSVKKNFFSYVGENKKDIIADICEDPDITDAVAEMVESKYGELNDNKEIERRNGGN